MKRTATCTISMVLAMFELGAAGGALAAAAQVGVISGGTIIWNGTAAATNQVTANYGNAYINGIMVSIAGTQLTTQNGVGTAVFCADTGTPRQQYPWSVYYVYYAAWNPGGGPFYVHVISTRPPSSEGYPSANLAFHIPGFPFDQVTQNAVFLGSYLTDGNSNMVPFERNGEEVILTPKMPGGQPFNQGGNIFIWPAFPNAPSAFSVSFTNQRAWLPATAAAVIVDLSLQNASQVGQDLYVLDPIMNTLPTCDPYAQAALPFTANTTTQYYGLRVKPMYIWLPLGLCGNPGGGGAFTVSARYVGYIEPTHHLY